ncbi:MAG: hypothetical protein KF749_02495 [Bacteroidetes bacterium]|nr:hypothetical protein [Bacteroidota bacterium]MCW5897408.1 hypothetical protein [Bacteroidota bacterium]
MSSFHAMMSIGALVLLTTILMGYNQRTAMSALDITRSKEALAMTALGSSYIEFAQGLAYDRYSDTASVPPGNASLFTSSASLGPDGGNEDTLTSFNDFDDLNGYQLDRTGPDARVYRASFNVRYVLPSDVNAYTTGKTFSKRLDIKLWRINPPFNGADEADTVRLHYVMGYFLFE